MARLECTVLSHMAAFSSPSVYEKFSLEMDIARYRTNLFNRNIYCSYNPLDF